MLSASDLFKTDIADNNSVWLEATLTLADGTEMNLTGADFFDAKFTQASSAGGQLQLGACIVGTFEASLNNTEGKFNDITLEDAVIEPTVYKLLSDGTTEGIAKGEYYLEKPNSIGSTLSIVGNDVMSRLLGTYKASLVSATSLTVATFVKDILTACGLETDDDLTTFNNHDVEIYVGGITDESVTINTVLAEALAIMNVFALATQDGKVKFRWYDDSSVESISAVFNSTLGTESIEITGVCVIGDSTTMTTKGSDGYVIDLSNRFITISNYEAIAEGMNEDIIGLKFRNCSATVYGNPLYEAGDCVSINGTQTFITRLEYAVNGNSTLSTELNTYAQQTEAHANNVKNIYTSDAVESAKASTAHFIWDSETQAAYVSTDDHKINGEQNIKIGTNALEVREGKTSVASFNGETTRIGQEAYSHTEITQQFLKTLAYDGICYFKIGTLNNVDGTPTIRTYEAIGDGSTKKYTVSNEVYMSSYYPTTVTVDGEEVTYTLTNKTFTLNSTPTRGASIIITYYTTDLLFSSTEGKRVGDEGNFSHAEGDSTTASGYTSHAEGCYTIASGYNSHAEGCYTIASGYTSHAEGSSTTASERNSHAEGDSTTASGYNSHAEGDSTTALGYTSHAEGDSTTASGYASHAEGYYTIASGMWQHVQGKYNIENSSPIYAHIVGNGSGDDNRSNAHTLDWSGNAWYAGYLTADEGLIMSDATISVLAKYGFDSSTTYS